jgi:hypothetical protein
MMGSDSTILASSAGEYRQLGSDRAPANAGNPRQIASAIPINSARFTLIAP